MRFLYFHGAFSVGGAGENRIYCISCIYMVSGVYYGKGVIPLSNSASLYERLISGEKVLCEHCKTGYMLPFHPDAPVNHSYIYSYCGIHLHRDGIVDIISRLT